MRHDLPRKKEDVLTRARKTLGWKGTDDEIIKNLTKPDKTVPKDYYPGVFCDLKGTLFSDRGELNENLLEKLYKESRPVTLWTDDLGYGTDMLKNYNIDFPLLPKNIFYGSTIEEAYDDLPKEKFEKMNIKVKTYHQVCFS